MCTSFFSEQRASEGLNLRPFGSRYSASNFGVEEVISGGDKTLLWDGLNIQKVEIVCQESKTGPEFGFGSGTNPNWDHSFFQRSLYCSCVNISSY